MSMTDPIADMLTRIRNGIQARHERVDVPASKLKIEIAKILREEGFISDFKVTQEAVGRTLKISLRYASGWRSVINGIERVSRPGRRVYRGKGEIPRVLGGLGLAIMSTPKGVLSGVEAARQGVGGEVLCQVW